MVEFPISGLNLKEFVLNKSLPFDEEVKEEKVDLIYDLYAICNHFGGLGGGHYTAYCKNNNDGKWYNFDDAMVTEVTNLENMISSSAYVLFYKRRDFKDDYDFSKLMK